MRRGGALLALTGLAACASAHPAGPDEADLQRLIAQARPGSRPLVRDVRCDFMPEEGSEWRCRYSERASDGRRVQLETYVALNGEDWVLIEAVVNPDQAPP